ncbi:MAG: sulfotransferase [Bacteroidia bacterium]|nr:sulfotransferase [Bacteroidia bacterium]
MLKRIKKPFLPMIVSLGKRLEKKKFSDPPILIGGCARSGTTILTSVLSSHNDIFACPRELGLFSKLERKSDGQIIAVRIDRLYRSLLVNRIPPNAKRWLEKSPNNVRSIKEIDEYFSGRFKFIHIIRDGRDVVLSVHPTQKDRYWVEPQRWVEDVSKGLEYAQHPNVHQLKYEDLVMKPDKSIEELCDFLEIPFSPEIQNWQSNATVRRHNAYRNGLQPLQASSIEKWKQEKFKERVEEFLAYPGTSDLLARLGYE